MHSTILSGGGGGFKRDERELSLNACVTKVRNTSDIGQNKFSYFYMLSHQESLAFSLRGSRSRKQIENCTFPFIKFRNEESPVNLPCISSDCERKPRREESVQPPRWEGESFQRICFCQMKKGLATFDIMFPADQGWGQKQNIIFFFPFFSGKTQLQSAFLHHVFFS